MSRTNQMTARSLWNGLNEALVFPKLAFAIAAVLILRIDAKAAEQPRLNSLPTAAYVTLLNRYCITCHNQKLKTADLMLDKLDVARVSEGAPIWEKVVRKLRTGAMPPAGLPRPDKDMYDSFAGYLESELDRAAATHPNPGRPVVHRLNRAEYAN